MSVPIRRIQPAGMPLPAGHYAPVVVANGMAFVSGQLPILGDGTKLTGAPFEVQARQVLDNVRVALEAAGSSIERLVQVRVYVTDMSHWPTFNAIYAEWAGDTRPARAVIPCGTLNYGLAVEVEAVGLA